MCGRPGGRTGVLPSRGDVAHDDAGFIINERGQVTGPSYTTRWDMTYP